MNGKRGDDRTAVCKIAGADCPPLTDHASLYSDWLMYCPENRLFLCCLVFYSAHTSAVARVLARQAALQHLRRVLSVARENTGGLSAPPATRVPPPLSQKFSWRRVFAPVVADLSPRGFGRWTCLGGPWPPRNGVGPRATVAEEIPSHRGC